tara:strand:- start:315 stop:515 length:201 start_codon:yes stop_codon:yes gene_type:complete
MAKACFHASRDFPDKQVSDCTGLRNYNYINILFLFIYAEKFDRQQLGAPGIHGAAHHDRFALTNSP